MTKEQHAEVKARCAAATPGPWEEIDKPAMSRHDHGWRGVFPGNNKMVAVRREAIWKGRTQMSAAESEEVRRQLNANRRLAAHARTDLPAALAEIERLRAIAAATKELIAAIKHSQALREEAMEAEDLGGGIGSWRDAIDVVEDLADSVPPIDPTTVHSGDERANEKPDAIESKGNTPE